MQKILGGAVSAICLARLFDWTWEHSIEIAIFVGFMFVPCWESGEKP